MLKLLRADTICDSNKVMKLWLYRKPTTSFTYHIGKDINSSYQCEYMGEWRATLDVITVSVHWDLGSGPF